jgi:hypothetical protein
LKWFQSNQLFLNPIKTTVVQFTPTKVPTVLNIQYAGHTFPQAEVVRFLGLQLDKQITWRNHLHFLLNKLSKACFVLRRLHYVPDIDALKLVYFAYFQSVVKYGIVFWGNSYNLNKVFLLQKRILRIMLGLSFRSSCKSWFKKLDILTVPCLYIFSSAMFVINNPSYFQTNTALYGTDTRQKNKLHKPLYKLSSIQKGIIYTAINVYNKLPSCITQLQHDEVRFRNALKKYLLMHTFYTVEEFLSQ